MNCRAECVRDVEMLLLDGVYAGYHMAIVTHHLCSKVIDLSVCAGAKRGHCNNSVPSLWTGNLLHFLHHNQSL